MARSKSSGRWLREHFDDLYVRRAQQAGYRSRAVFKLQEINDCDRLIRPVMTIVDLGAGPGGWSQLARELAGRSGRVVALDILPMHPLQADFADEAALRAALDGAPVDLVMSDMAPNISGESAVDQSCAIYLAELALEFTGQVLRPGGDFLVKVFQGEGFDAYLRKLSSFAG